MVADSLDSFFWIACMCVHHEMPRCKPTIDSGSLVFYIQSIEQSPPQFLLITPSNNFNLYPNRCSGKPSQPTTGPHLERWVKHVLLGHCQSLYQTSSTQTSQRHACELSCLARSENSWINSYLKVVRSCAMCFCTLTRCMALHVGASSSALLLSIVSEQSLSNMLCFFLWGS